MKTIGKGLVVLISTVGALALAPAAMAHGDAHAKPKKAPVRFEETAFGRTGDPREVSRTIKIGMNDAMHFTPGDLVVRRGATIRFDVGNHGKLMHEMVIGTMKELKAHAELMQKFPGMEHGEPYIAHVAPGEDDTIVWQFTKPGEFHYACLIPGHMEAGMIARITVK